MATRRSLLAGARVTRLLGAGQPRLSAAICSTATAPPAAPAQVAAWAARHQASWGAGLRGFSGEAQGKKGKKEGEGGKKEGDKAEAAAAEQPGGEADEEGAAGAAGEADGPQLSVEELQELVKQGEAEKAELEAQLSETKERLIYTLADMENLRTRTTRQAEDTKKFAIQGFVKSILEVADNLERASNAVDTELLAEGAEQLDAATATKMLRSMLEGVQMTEKVLLQVFAQNGIEKVSPLGDTFDPNLHQALFEMPDPEREPGTIGAVTKAGYVLHGRVVRPADVGVVKA
mmetsp:Transcript_17041/g.44225  ORF Transcript_17041/g.44225 Transcript_17041/m.44225 type:complete len:290 (-) Transcript_17041:154-1023(-)